MGEVATALAAFDDAFGRTLGALRASDVSEGSAWPTQKRASSLVLDLRRDVPPHVAAAKLVAAGELALSRGQWALAQTSCFAQVLALGLVRAGAETDPRWHPSEADAKGSPFGRVDRVALHVRAVLGNARCDVTRVREHDAGVRLTSTRNALRAAANDARDAAALSMETHESLYWLVRNATGVVRDASALSTGAGYGADVIHALVFAVRALESHALLATPRHLAWRLSLVAATVACFDDCAAAAAAASGETAPNDSSDDSSNSNVRAAGDAFLRSAKASIEDLKSLEAMDAVPMDDARRRAYADADARLAAMEAARDPAAAAAFAEALLAEEPEDDSGTSSSRLLLEALASASGAALETLAGAVKDWVARRTDAAFAFHRHARAVSEAEARRAEDDAEENVATEPSTEPSPASGDAEAESAPAPLSPAAAAAHARTLRDLPVPTHAALLKRTRLFADGAAFGALVRYANLRVESSNKDSGDFSVETAASAEDAAAATTLRSVVDLLVAAHVSEGKVVEGGERESFEEERREEGTEPEPELEPETEPEPERPKQTVSAIEHVCAALESADADVSVRFCAEATRAAGFFAWRFAQEKLQAFSEVSSLQPLQVPVGEGYRPIVDPEDEPLVVSTLRAAKRAFELVDFSDGALKAAVSLRLADLLERRGGVENLRDALLAAESAVKALDAARDESVSNAVSSFDAASFAFAHGNLAEAVWDFRRITRQNESPTKEGLNGTESVLSSSNGFAFVSAGVSETVKRTACLHADAVTKAAHLRFLARLNAMGYSAERGIATLPSELREETIEIARDNKWEAAAAKTESALFLSRASARQKALHEAADLMEEAEKSEREAFRVSLEGARALRDERLSERSEKEKDGPKTSVSRLVPDAPLVLGATSGTVTLLPPDFSRLRHALRARAAPVATHFAVVCVPFGAGFAPGIRNDGFPGTGGRREIKNENGSVTVSGLRRNVAYAFAVVAFDASGAVINGVGEATKPVLAAHAMPGTCMWSRLATVASKVGCREIATRASSTVRRRFCVVEKHAKIESSTLPRNPVTSQRLRREVVNVSSPATLRAASRAMLVSAEAAAAAKIPPASARLEAFDAFLESDRAPLPELRVPKHREHLVRLDVAKRSLLAMELAGYAGDETLAQEAALRAGNVLADVFASPSKKPRAALAFLNQACALLESVCGKAKTPAFSRLAASFMYELIREARRVDETATLRRVARVTLTTDAMTPPLGARNEARGFAEELLLSFPEWRSFESTHLADRAEAAAADEARDPVAAVYAALGVVFESATSEAPLPPASAGFEALNSLLTPESLAEDPGVFMRAFGVALDAAAKRVQAGDASEASIAKTNDLVTEWATRVFAMCDEVTSMSPPAYPESGTGKDDDYAGAPLEEEDEARVAALEEKAEEARPTYEAGAPEQDDDAENDAEATAAFQKAVAEYEAAKDAVETAVAAREEASKRAAARQRAATCLTRLAPPLFARRTAALQSRAVVRAQTPWRARACVALGRVAWEAREAEALAKRAAGESVEDLRGGETPPEGKEGGGTEDAKSDAAAEKSRGPPALALGAMTLLTRGVELGARAGSHHTVASATRALYDLARSPALGRDADARFAEGGGARLLAVAGGRVLEHLRRLKRDAVRAAAARDVTRLPDDDDDDERVSFETSPDASTAHSPVVPSARPESLSEDPDPTSVVVAVAGGARVSPLASAAARDATKARASKKALAPETQDASGKNAFASLAVAFASENMPEYMDGGVEAWFASMPNLGIETLVRFINLAVDVCVAAGHHRRAGRLALELCDVVGTNRVALDLLPKALLSLRRCEAEDGEVGPALADAAESALRRARSAVPEHVMALRAARESFEFKGGVEAEKEEKEKREKNSARKRSRTVSLYRAAARAAAAAGDRPAASQAQLELGDALCAAGDVEEAVCAWGACLDGVVGRYDVAFDAAAGGCRSLPASPEATLGMFGLRGCLRAAAAAARLATRTVRKPFRVDDEQMEGFRDLPGDASSNERVSSALGVSARTEIARVASRLFEAASRASLGDGRFFGGGFCGLDEPDAVSSSSASPGPETDVTWEALGDGVADGWDAFNFDARATCDDALAVSDFLLGANRPMEAAAAAALAEALAARRLSDLHRVVDARLKRSAAMADADALGVSAALLLSTVEGADLPSIAGGAAGRTLAPPPPRPAENAGDAGDAADAAEAMENSFADLGPPKFADDEPLWSTRNKRVASYVASAPVAEEIKAAYGEFLAEAVELGRARWLAAAAAAAAPKAKGADPETDILFFASSAKKESSDEDGVGDANEGSASLSHEPGGRDDALASAKSTLLSVLDRACGQTESLAAKAQEALDAMAEKVDQAAAEKEARREARAAAEKARREAREAAEAKRAFDGDWSDAERDEEAENAESKEDPEGPETEKQDALDAEDEPEDDASGSRAPEEDADFREPCAKDKGAHEWLMASPERLALILDASLLLSRCLRLRRDVAGARRVARDAAEKADALAAGAGGRRAAAAAKVAARVGAARRVALRVESVEAGFALGLDFERLATETDAALTVATAFGDADAARRLRFAKARAAAASGDVSAAESALESLLAECRASRTLNPFDGKIGGFVASELMSASTPASASFFAAVARRLARLKQRRGDHEGAATAMAPALVAARRAAAARGGLGPRLEIAALDGSKKLTSTRNVNAHATATACFVATATRWAECALLARGAGVADVPVLANASRALRDAADAARRSATVSASAEARVATRAAFAARAAVAERRSRYTPTRDASLDVEGSENSDSADVTELEDVLRSLRRAGRLALSPAAGHDVYAAKEAALELFSTRALLAEVLVRNASSDSPFAERLSSLGAGILLRVSENASENADARNSFLASCVACLRAAHSASSMLLLAGDATRRAEIAASLSMDACPPAAAARAEAEEAARRLGFDASPEDTSASASRRVLASRFRAAHVYDSQEALDDDGDVRVGGDGGETLAFLGETHVAFMKESETYATTLCFAETPECFREPPDSARDETADETAASVLRPGSVFAQWRIPAAPPVSFRAERRTKNKRPATLAFVVATSETSSDAASETGPGPSTTLVGEICLDVALVREAQRAVREARAAARAAEPRPSADAGNDPDADADADADPAADAAAADAKAKASETAKRAMALVASLFATKASSGEELSLVDGDAEPDPDEKDAPFAFLPATSSFLETLEAFVSPERGVVAEDDAAFAAFVEAAVSGRTRRERSSLTGSVANSS